MPYTRVYLGKLRGPLNGRKEYEPFRAASVPTEASHGALYSHVIGPFRTRRAANWGATYPFGWTTVQDCERRSKLKAYSNGGPLAAPTLVHKEGMLTF
jgi:hypothetical protein